MYILTVFQNMFYPYDVPDRKPVFYLEIWIWNSFSSNTIHGNASEKACNDFIYHRRLNVLRSRPSNVGMISDHAQEEGTHLMRCNNGGRFRHNWISSYFTHRNQWHIYKTTATKLPWFLEVCSLVFHYK